MDLSLTTLIWAALFLTSLLAWAYFDLGNHHRA